MPFNEDVVNRVREILGDETYTEKKMFGGLSFMINGNMAVGVNRDHLTVRVGPDNHDEAVARKGASIMSFAGRPTRGWVQVTPDGYSSEADLKEWVQRGVTVTSALPPK